MLEKRSIREIQQHQATVTELATLKSVLMFMIQVTANNNAPLIQYEYGEETGK